MQFILSILLALLLAYPAQAQKTKAQLITEIGTNFPDNTSGLITPSILRTTVTDFVNSWNQALQVNAQVGTTYTFLVGDYGQLVTFTNASPVAVTLPQATGTFAVWNATACNKGAGAVTITPTTSTIGGAATLVLQQNQCRVIVSDGTNYQLTGADIPPITCAASNWISAITAALVATCSQPAFTDISGTLAVNKGGTGLTSGTSGGVPYFSAGTTMASSGALTQFGIVYGGGAGGAPAATAAGTNAQILLGQSASAPTWNTLSGDASVTTTGVWTNSKVNAVAYPASPGTNTVPVVTSANTITYEAVPNAALANSTITLNAGTSVGLTAPGSMALGTTNTIGAITDVPRFAGINVPVVKPNADSTTALKLTKSDGTTGVVVIDTTNARVGINKTPGTFDFDVNGNANIGSTFSFGVLDATSLANSPSTITGLTVNNSPSATNDYLLYYNSTDGKIRKCTVGSCTSAGTAGVSSLNGLTGGLSVVAGAGLSVSASGSSITVAAQGKVYVGTQSFCPSGCTTTVSGGGTATYARSTGVTLAIVEVIGGGGGGAGVVAGNGSTTLTAGGGGGGGGYCLKDIPSVANGVTITVGAAGTAGASSGADGGTGGTSSFDTGGANYRATGGVGGVHQAANTKGSSPGGAGGAGAACDLNISGGVGFPSLWDASAFEISGAGGQSGHGFGGGGAAVQAGTGTAGGNYGGGGSGGAGGTGAAATGGAGAAGIVLVHEYI